MIRYFCDIDGTEIAASEKSRFSLTIAESSADGDRIYQHTTYRSAAHHDMLDIAIHAPLICMKCAAAIRQLMDSREQAQDRSDIP